MRYGNCLTAALRKRREGVMVLTWHLNRRLPHFYVRARDGRRLDVSSERWDRWAIRFLGDDAVEPSLPECLWHRYEDTDRSEKTR